MDSVCPLGRVSEATHSDPRVALGFGRTDERSWEALVNENQPA